MAHVVAPAALGANPVAPVVTASDKTTDWPLSTAQISKLAPEASQVIHPISGPFPTALELMDAPTSTTLTMHCPRLDQTPSVNNDANTFTFRATCPYRIVDDEDLMGSPQIAVDPQNPNNLAFLSLHGCSTPDGPTPRSRAASCTGLRGQTFTTFTSMDQGASWFDNPWGQEGFGEHVATVMDQEGHVYIAALWAQRVGDERYDYHFKLYKGDVVDETFGSSYGYAVNVEARPDANGTRTHGVIEEVNLVLVKGREIVIPANHTGNQTRPGDVGNFTQPQPKTIHDNDRVAAVWFEKAGDGESPTGMSGWIDARWTDTGPKNKWVSLPKDELIGPCMKASNPIAYAGKIYVACTVDSGYSARSRARIGEIDIWEIDPATNSSAHIDYTGVDGGGRPRLAGRDDGFMAMMADQMQGDFPRIDVAYGFYGRHWEDPDNQVGDMGPTIHNALGGHPLLDARITAMALGKENTLFFSYVERSNMTALASDPSPTPPTPPDPATLGADDVPVEYRKIVATTNRCAGVIVSAIDLNIGKPRHPFPEETVGNATGAFYDSQDGMTLIQRVDDPNLEEIYFVYGDFGAIGYGIIDAKSGGTLCDVRLPPPFIPAPPIPVAIALANPFSTVVGLGVGTAAAAMVTYLLAVKRKLPVFTTAEDK